MPRRFNCCVFNHPCPIFCPINLACSNNIQNPTLPNEFAFLNNLAPSSIASNAVIPLGLANFFGNFVVPSDNGVSLTAGVYEVSYSVSGIIPENNTFSVGLNLDGVEVAGSTMTSAQQSTNEVNIQRTIVVNVPFGGLLQLVNKSSQSVDFSFASMFIRQL